MKTGLYKDSGGGEQNVIEVDDAAEMVLVDYGNGKTVWYAKEDYSTWTYAGEENVNTEPEVDTGEKNLDYQEPPEPASEETISDINENPITKEPKRRRTHVKKEKKSTPKKKK